MRRLFLSLFAAWRARAAKPAAADPELRRLLCLVLQKTERERASHLAFELAETDFITSRDPNDHDELRQALRKARRAFKHDRTLAVAATLEANEYLNAGAGVSGAAIRKDADGKGSPVETPAPQQSRDLYDDHELDAVPSA